MKGKNNRFFREGSAHHLYLKALDGNVLFYRTEDYIFYLTLLFVLAERYGISIEALSIMFNHTHTFTGPSGKAVFEAFRRDLQSMFSLGYNEEYYRTGPLMMPSGFAPKSSWKSIISCLCYIVNNPVAGRLCSSALEYKWNLLSYLVSDHPFSDRLVKRNCGFRMRKALRIVDDCFRKRKVLSYALQRQIFSKLSGREKRQAIDYIVSKYNPLDKDAFISRFGSFEKAILAIDATTGAEHDLAEPWEDYSIYVDMLKNTRSSGLNHHGFRFHEMDDDDLLKLVRKLSGIRNMTAEHLRRFLHVTRRRLE